LEAITLSQPIGHRDEDLLRLVALLLLVGAQLVEACDIPSALRQRP